MAVGPHGGFVVTWQGAGSSGDDSSYASIQAQRYVWRLFADGFEGGDVCGWSDGVGSGDVC